MITYNQFASFAVKPSRAWQSLLMVSVAIFICTQESAGRKRLNGVDQDARTCSESYAFTAAGTASAYPGWHKRFSILSWFFLATANCFCNLFSSSSVSTLLPASMLTTIVDPTFSLTQPSGALFRMMTTPDEPLIIAFMMLICAIIISRVRSSLTSMCTVKGINVKAAQVA